MLKGYNMNADSYDEIDDDNTDQLTDNENYEDLENPTLVDDDVIEDIILEVKNKSSNISQDKKSKRQYVNPVELHAELEKHIISKRINEDHVMGRKLAIMLIKITEELFEKGNFRGYHNGWKDEMKSKAYENLVKYVHQYRIDHVERFSFFLNWIYRVHTYKLQKYFSDKNLDYDHFLKNLTDVKRKIFKKSKDPNFVPSATYKKITQEDLYPYLLSINEDFESFKADLNKEYPDLYQQFEDHKRRNSFNYVTMIIYRSAQHVIKAEKKISNDNRRLDEAILYRTDDFDEEAIEKDNRFVTFDENKLDYGGFGI